MEKIPDEIKRKIAAKAHEFVKMIFDHAKIETTTDSDGPTKDTYVDGAEFGYSLSTQSLQEKEREIDSHILKLKELMALIEKYNSQTGETGCGNHVYNEIREHLAKTNNL